MLRSIFEDDDDDDDFNFGKKPPAAAAPAVVTSPVVEPPKAKVNLAPTNNLFGDDEEDLDWLK